MTMPRFLLLLSCGLASFCPLPSASAQTLNIQQVDAIQFTLAPGLAIERVAAEELIKWPVVADWDAAGRLVIVESAGVAQPIAEHNKQLLHRVVRLIDDNGDGHFDRRLVAADKLPFPEGVLCLGNDMLVSAPPLIWKLTDADGDGVCESREVWFDGQTLTGCANDLHGPYLGHDGWIYWCKGAFAEQSHELLNGQQLINSAAHIYRRKFSGGAIEPVMSGGMDNPVEVAFTPEGERFFTSTFLQHPGDGLRDGIAHAVYGGVYGKDHQPIAGLLRTGPLMPIMTQLGPAAPSGLICLESSQLLTPTPENPDARTLVAALFNLQKVTAHRLKPDAGTYQTEDIDLLTANRIDFHPTDILEDADGSLLIIDTGGWYDLCCPSSRVDQQTAAGGIYRLRRQKNPNAANAAQLRQLEPPQWSTASVQACVNYLDDPRPWVSRMATLRLSELSKLGELAVAPLSVKLHDRTLPLDQRLRGLWALSSVGTDAALAAIASVLNAEHPGLIQAACHAVAVHRYRPARQPLEKLLASAGLSANLNASLSTNLSANLNNDAALSGQQTSSLRAAAEALGRIGDSASVPSLMNCLHADAVSPVMSHSLRYALLELAAPAAIAPYLDSPRASQRVAAVFLLDKLQGHDHLSQARVVQGLTATSPAERELTIEILSRQPEWVAAAIPYLSQTPEPAHIPLYSAWREQPQVQQLVARWLDQRDSTAINDSNSGSLQRILSAWQGQELPQPFAAPLIQWLQQEPETFPTAYVAAANVTAPHGQSLVKAIQARVRAARDPQERSRLLNTLPANHSFDAPDLAAEQVALFVDTEGDQRVTASAALRRLQIDESSARRLAEALPELVPLELRDGLELISAAKLDAVDQQVLQQLPSLPAARTLPTGFVERLYRDRSAELQQLASSTATQLLAPTTDVAAEVDQWLKQLPEGDAVRGLQVFRSAKAACAGCHQLGYVGGRVGPELSRIGGSRTREALLEAILFPSSRIEQSYQSLKILTLDGQVYNGLLKHSDGRSLELQLAADKTIVIPIADIEKQAVSDISIMPAGMQEVLTPQEISDLLKLLEAAR